MMKTLKDELWSIKIYIKHFFKELPLDIKRLLDIRKVLLMILVIIFFFKFFISWSPNLKIIFLTVVYVLLYFRGDYLRGQHIHKEREELKKRIEDKQKETTK